MPKILLVEDDKELAQSLINVLGLDGYRIEHVETGEDAVQLFEHFNFDLIVLDWELPGIKGVDVLKKFRSSGKSSPVIFLTGRADVDSKECGLDTGADDYLTKPFDVRELTARIRSLLRRPSGLLPSKIRVGNLIIEPDTKKVFVSGGAVRLTNKEYSVLEFLVRHPNQVFGSKALLQSVWPSESEAGEDTVRACVKNLRRKISVDDECIVKTIPGAGYTIEVEAVPES